VRNDISKIVAKGEQRTCFNFLMKKAQSPSGPTENEGFNLQRASKWRIRIYNIYIYIRHKNKL